MLFTNQPLSIQVHPDDAFAHSMGLPNGKTEAWYVLSAAPDAKVALGLNRRLTPQQLREAVDDGSISDLVVWQTVSAGDAIFVPAGTIHAIGAGLVIAEIQQRSDATFRLFDYGRQRELHVESAIVAADAGPTRFSAAAKPVHRRTDASRFQSALRVRTDRSGAEFHLAPRRGARDMASRSQRRANAGSFDVATGDALFAQADRLDIRPGAIGMVGLVAYTGGGPVPHLLQHLRQPSSIEVEQPQEIKVPAALAQTNAAATTGRLESAK